MVLELRCVRYVLFAKQGLNPNPNILLASVRINVLNVRCGGVEVLGCILVTRQSHLMTLALGDVDGWMDAMGSTGTCI